MGKSGGSFYREDTERDHDGQECSSMHMASDVEHMHDGLRRNLGHDASGTVVGTSGGPVDGVSA